MSSSLYTLLVLAGVAIYGIVLFNRLVTLRNRWKNGFSQIEVQLQRRYELIPNLVKTASAYMKHERDTLLSVTEARNIAAKQCQETSANPNDGSLMAALAGAENQLSQALGKLNFTMENYPELKADMQMRELSEELASTENRVAYARQAYSDAVMTYNTEREQFPAMIISALFAFKAADLFEIEDPRMNQVVDVNFA